MPINWFIVLIRLSDPEEVLLMSTLRDMNLSKLVAQDVPLFLSLIRLCPKSSIQVTDLT